MAGGYNVVRQGHLVRGHPLPAAQDHRRAARNGETSCSPCGPTTASPGSSAICGRRSAPPSSASSGLQEIIDRYGAAPSRRPCDSRDRRRPPPLLQGDRRLARRHLRGRRLRRRRPRRATSDIHVHVQDHRRRRPADRRLRGFRQPPRDRAAGRPSATPGATPSPSWPAWSTRPSPRTRGSSTASSCASRSGCCLNPTEGKPVSSGTHHPGVEVGDAIALAMSQIIPDRCSPQTYKFGSPRQMWGDQDPRTGKPFFDHGGEVSAGWVNAVQGRRRMGSALPSAMRQPDQGRSRDQRGPLPAHPPRPQLHHRLGRRRAVAGRVRQPLSSRRSVRRPTSTSTSSTSATSTPGSPAATTARPDTCTSSSGRPEDQVVGLARRSPGTCWRPASSSSTTSVAEAAGATRCDATPRPCSRTSGTSTSRSRAPGATTGSSSPARSRRWTSRSTLTATEALRAETGAGDAGVTRLPHRHRRRGDVHRLRARCAPTATVVLEKTPTTPADQSIGVLAGLARLAEAEGLPTCAAPARAHRVDRARHDDRRQHHDPDDRRRRPGCIVTEGFRDEIELRRCFKEDIWDPALPAPDADRPPPGAPRGARAPDRRGRGRRTRSTRRPCARRRSRLRAFGVTSIAVVVLALVPQPDARAAGPRASSWTSTPTSS